MTNLQIVNAGKLIKGKFSIYACLFAIAEREVERPTI